MHISEEKIDLEASEEVSGEECATCCESRLEAYWAGYSDGRARLAREILEGKFEEEVE